MFGKPPEKSPKRATKQPVPPSVEKKRKKRREIKIVGGLVAGAVGGIVATWVLDRYQEGALEATRRAESAVDVDPVFSRRQEDLLRDKQRAQGDTAHRIARSFGRGLSRSQRRQVAPFVHYAVGALAGGAYGLSSEFLPIVRKGYGTGFSNILFLGGSEALLPWVNIATGRKQVRPPAHAGALSSAFLFGAVLETVRRVLRWVL